MDAPRQQHFDNERPDAEGRAVNRMRPAGIGVDADIHPIVSGMPAGGPDDLAVVAHDEAVAGDASARERPDAFGMGMNDYSTGVPRDGCPYPDGTEADRWREGWEYQRNAEGVA